jgi:hypothetical protein
MIERMAVTRHLRISIGVYGARLPKHRMPVRAAGGFVGGCARPALLALVLEPASEPPAGQVQLGCTGWRFSNRVELLEAIDFARERAVQAAS